MTEPSGWTFETLKAYLDARLEDQRDAAVVAIQEKDKRDQQRFEAQTRAIDAASLVVDRALVEARQGVADQFRGVITKLDQLGDTVGVPRQEMDLALASAASNRHVEIADAIGAVVKQFSADLERLTKAVEMQGEQFMKVIVQRDEQRGDELKRLTTKVEGIETGVSDLNAIQLQRQGRSAGVSWTGKTVTTLVSVAVGLIVILGFLFAHPWRP